MNLDSAQTLQGFIPYPQPPTCSIAAFKTIFTSAASDLAEFNSTSPLTPGMG